MPYKVGKSSSCPASKPHAVQRDDGSVVPGGCHPTREKALSHQRALMANVPDAQDKTSAEKASLFERPVAQTDPRRVLEQTVELADMDTITCPDCGGQVQSNATSCPNCYLPINLVKSKRKKRRS